MRWGEQAWGAANVLCRCKQCLRVYGQPPLRATSNRAAKATLWLLQDLVLHPVLCCL
jgi:hypothetical protein